MSIDAFEQAVNEISDTDWTWWPFLWLRPPAHQPLTLARIVAMAILYGVPLSGISGIGLRCASVQAQSFLPFAMLGYPLAFLFLGSVIIGPMWNRRAERLRARVLQSSDDASKP